MQRKRSFPAILAVALVLVVAVAGCGSNNVPQPSPVPPTKTPRPTFTPTAAVTPTRLLVATATTAATAAQAQAPATATPAAQAAAPTATPEPAVPQLTANQTVNVRGGPGTAYATIGQLQAGDNFKIMAKNKDGSWLQFNFEGDPAWVNAGLVTMVGDLNSVQVAQNIPQPPTAAPVPVVQQPAPQPKPQAQPTAAPAPPQPSFNWAIAPGSVRSGPQCGTAHFEGKVQYKNGSPQNGVCVYLGYYGPRKIVYSGGGGKGDGNWGFAPCGNGPCKGPFEIYVVACPANVPPEGLTLDPNSSAPAPANSEKFQVTITDKCQTGQWENIVFRSTTQ